MSRTDYPNSKKSYQIPKLEFNGAQNLVFKSADTEKDTGIMKKVTHETKVNHDEKVLL